MVYPPRDEGAKVVNVGFRGPKDVLLYAGDYDTAVM